MPHDEQGQREPHKHDAGHRQDAPETLPPDRFWEERYASSDRVWSGQPNATLVAIATHLTPGRALDLGCGEGADVLWLAGRGWRATGLDISQTAISRARRAAAEAGIADGRASFRTADLAHWQPGPAERAELVTAAFLHSPVELPRERILRNAARAVAPGGRLLIISHAAPPPWADVPHDHAHLFPGIEEQLAALAPDPGAWHEEITEVRERETTGPEGQAAVLRDAVILLRAAG